VINAPEQRIELNLSLTSIFGSLAWASQKAEGTCGGIAQCVDRIAALRLKFHA
jgi:hypothetical protein